MRWPLDRHLNEALILKMVIINVVNNFTKTVFFKIAKEFKIVD